MASFIKIRHLIQITFYTVNNTNSHVCVPLGGGPRTHSVLSLTSSSFETGPLCCFSTVYIRVVDPQTGYSPICLESRGPGATDVCATCPAFP